MNVAQTLRSRIPAILSERGLSISDLQRRTGLSYPAVHNMARAEMISDETRIGTLRRVGDALGVSIGELFTEENGEPALNDS